MSKLFPIRSLYWQFSLVFICIAVFVLFAAAPALVLTELSTSSGSAINISGSLRMQSYKLTFVVSNPYSSGNERRINTETAVSELEKRLKSPGLTDDLPKDINDPVRLAYDQILGRFELEIAPLALKSIENESARRTFMANIGDFVDEVDRFVHTLESNLASRLSLLRIILLVTLLGSISVTWFMLSSMRNQIFRPIRELEEAMSSVRSGDFSVHIEKVKDNEIGRLASGFNFMVEELSRLYGSLEEEVKKKTRDLDLRNRGLQFLNASADDLYSAEGHVKEKILTVLEGSLQHTQAKACSVSLYVKPGEDRASYSFVETGRWREMSELPGEQQTAFPILDSRGVPLGLLKICVEEVPEWKADFFSMVAGMVGRSLSAELRLSDDRRLAVLEERSTIARELHDSIAQSLSFARIQLLRLKLSIEGNAEKTASLEIFKELEEGVVTAYRQLREVLTAFRIQIKSQGLSGAVEEAVEEFRNRTGCPVSVTSHVAGYELSANAQVHLSYILREALVNIEKHAKATRVEIKLEHDADGSLRLEVLDNGIGIPESAEKAMHFGLNIMKERAEALNATITVGRRPEGGTAVVLVCPKN